MSGRGVVRSWVIFHQVYYPELGLQVPYNVIQVELAEGPHLLSNLVGVPLEQIRAGLPVEVVFQPLDDEFNLPLFRPLSAE